MTNSKISPGPLRHESELRQICGLLMALGMAAVFQPLVGVVSAISPNGETVTTGIPFANLFGGLSVIAIGILAVFIGFSKLVYNWHNKQLTFFSLFLTQLAFIPYITGMTNVGKLAQTGAAFIPAEYNPTSGDVKFVGACGILSIMSYGFAFIGGISYLQFSLYAHLGGKFFDRTAMYFRGRATLYSTLFFVAGLSQFLLGTYTLNMFGGAGALEFGPIAVAQVVISFPGISIFLGLMQMTLGIWGVLRSKKIGIFFDRDFSSAMFAAWFLQILLQVLVQVGRVPGAGSAGAAPTITGFTAALNLMPAYLDFKGRSLPEEIPDDYYTDNEGAAPKPAESMEDAPIPVDGAEDAV